MASTFTPAQPIASSRRMSGNQRQVIGTITFDASYPTGGLAITPGQFGLTAITDVKVAGGTSGYHVFWNRSTTAPTLQVFQGDNANVAAAPGIQVPNATNLSTLVVDIEVMGY